MLKFVSISYLIDFKQPWDLQRFAVQGVTCLCLCDLYPDLKKKNTLEVCQELKQRVEEICWD